MFVNKVDASNDKEIEELVELEVRELLAKYNYDGDNASIIFGSALHALQGTRPEIGKQRVLQLLQAMDDNIKVPKRDVDKPFVLSIEGTYQIAGRGTVVTGTVDSGKVKVGDEVEIIGYSNKVHKTVVTGVETFKKSLDFGEAGDNIGLLLRGITRNDAHRGMCLAKPGFLKAARNIEVNLYILSDEEGGRKKPFANGFTPQMFIRTADVAAQIILPDAKKMVMPGDNLVSKLKLNFPLPVEIGQRFALREGHKTIAAGVVSKILPDDPGDEKAKTVSK